MPRRHVKAMPKVKTQCLPPPLQTTCLKSCFLFPEFGRGNEPQPCLPLHPNECHHHQTHNITNSQGGAKIRKKKRKGKPELLVCNNLQHCHVCMSVSPLSRLSLSGCTVTGFQGSFSAKCARCIQPLRRTVRAAKTALSPPIKLPQPKPPPQRPCNV